MNNKEAMQKAFEEFCKTLPSMWNANMSRSYAEVFFNAGFQADLASQVQQPTELSAQLREYASDSGYSHHDYADTMLAAAYEIERCAARLAASQAQNEQDQQPAQEPSLSNTKYAERKNWTTKDWMNHVGAWEAEHHTIKFGSVMAVSAMLVQFQQCVLWQVSQQPVQEQMNELEALRKQLKTAVSRINDMLESDDGQAHKEARKFIESLLAPPQERSREN